jgi:hypothetical protein
VICDLDLRFSNPFKFISCRDFDLRVFYHVDGHNHKCPNHAGRQQARWLLLCALEYVCKFVFHKSFDCSVEYLVCLVCGCRLTSENRSEVLNVCKECLHSLEF